MFPNNDLCEFQRGHMNYRHIGHKNGTELYFKVIIMQNINPSSNLSLKPLQQSANNIQSIPNGQNQVPHYIVFPVRRAVSFTIRNKWWFEISISCWLLGERNWHHMQNMDKHWQEQNDTSQDSCWNANVKSASSEMTRELNRQLWDSDNMRLMSYT